LTAADVLPRIIARLNWAEIPHMLVGSFSAAAHGAPRATQDIDLVIDSDEARLRVFLRSLPFAEYYVDEDAAIEALRDRTQFNVIDLATGWKIDLIIRKARPFSVEEFERRQPVELEGVRLAVASAEDTIIAKLEWAHAGGSTRQLEDVASILLVRHGELDLNRIDRWVASLDVAREWAAARRLAEER